MLEPKKWRVGAYHLTLAHVRCLAAYFQSTLRQRRPKPSILLLGALTLVGAYRKRGGLVTSFIA